MESLELVLWISITYVLMMFNEKPIYEYLLDAKQRYDIYFGKYNVDDLEELTE